MTEPEQTDLLPLSTPGEKALDAAAIAIGIAPWLGGPLAAVLTGMSSARKMRRIREVLATVSADVNDLRTDVQRMYVRSEDFEDLLEQTLRVAAAERNQEKREMYGAFLAGAINSPGEPPYDEQIRILRTLEQLQSDHVRLIKAIAQIPDLTNPGLTDSPINVLRARLPEMPEPRIDDLVQQVNDLRIANTGELRVMMTWEGAQDLRSTITPFGKRFLAFLKQT